MSKFIRITDKNAVETLLNVDHIIKVASWQNGEADPTQKGVQITTLGAESRNVFQDVSRSFNEWEGIVCPE